MRIWPYGRKPNPPPPLSSDEVLRAERAALRPDGGATPLRALCISGGGIRSATFALGALQRLTEQGLLPQFDYLSTVSGGGYIGGWLTAWLKRAGGMTGVLPELLPDASVPKGEPDPVEHLRAYNNYLTPRLGAMSADAWTLGVTVTRNVFLNWLVFIPLLLAAMMLPRLWLALNQWAVAAPATVQMDLGWTAALLFLVSLWNIMRYLPGLGGVNHSTGHFLAFVLAPLTVAAALFAGLVMLRTVNVGDILAGTLLPCLLAWLGCAITGWRRHAGKRRELFALLGAVMGLGLGVGIAALALPVLLAPDGWARSVSIGAPLLLFGFNLAGAIFVGLSSHVLGTLDREWLARAGAYISLVICGWLVGFAAVLLAPAWLFGHPWKQWGATGLGAASAWASAHLGYLAPSTKAKAAGAGGTETPAPGLGHWLLLLAPALFLAILVVGLGMATDWMMAFTGSVSVAWTAHRDLVANTWWPVCLFWLAIFVVFGWFMARYININKFSLQGMYRDRLIRAYLGASNSRESVNRFTGFSPTDDFALSEIDARQRPFHVVNMTLNLVGGERLAWQQRKAEPFTATPLHCGTPGLGYRPSSVYGGEGGMTLGTAVAISGAAASPNMGYHSSPLVGFIMTLFNVRLGAWLGNPGAAGDKGKAWTHAGPHSAARSLIREAMGETTDTSPYVYLSDGGHFENLGLYEMVRRRCATIVVLDGGCDPNYTYEDLGNALRKIRIDLKVPIKFHFGQEHELPVRQTRCAVARIQYSAVDSACADGQLIYIKPVLLGNEPPDVSSYAQAHPAFPHQSTAEQWFDESQTESYRMLGICSIADLCRDWKGRTLEDLAQHLAAGPAAPQATAASVG